MQPLVPFLAALPTLLPAALFLVPLFWQRKEQMFTLAVNPQFLNSAEASRLRRAYFCAVVALGAGGFAASYFAIARSVASPLAWLLIAAPIAEIACLLLMWAWAWKRTLPHRIPHATVRSASLTEKSATPGWWISTLAAWLPLAVSAVRLHQNWLQIPARFPTHWGLDGQPNGWTTRSLAGVSWPLDLAAGIILTIAAMGWVLDRYSTASSTPVLKHMTLNMLRAVCWLMAAMFSGIALLPLMQHPERSILWIVAGMLVATLAIVAYAIVTILRHQSSKQLQQATPDSAWKWGMIYFNPQDAALFVPKRMGNGFTFNFARPAAWLMIAALLALAITPLFFIHGSHRH